MSGTPADSGSKLSIAARISNHVVGQMSAYTGRGPTRAWTSIHEDLISVVLRDTLNKDELSDNHIDPDVAIESFVLEPRGPAAS